jgi:hypothetical protein
MGELITFFSISVGDHARSVELRSFSACACFWAASLLEIWSMTIPTQITRNPRTRVIMDGMDADSPRKRTSVVTMEKNVTVEGNR